MRRHLIVALSSVLALASVGVFTASLPAAFKLPANATVVEDSIQFILSRC